MRVLAMRCYTHLASNLVQGAALMERSRLGEPGPTRAQKATALGELYESYYDRIARYIALRIGNWDSAQELAGDVFLRAVESLDTFQWRGIPMQAWLFRIAHNLLVDHLRKHSKRSNLPLEEAFGLSSSSNPQHEVETKLQMEEVLKAMDSLSPAQREVVTLRLLGGLSAAEAGQLMGRTSGAVRELQRTALQALRKALKQTSEDKETPKNR